MSAEKTKSSALQGKIYTKEKKMRMKKFKVAQ